MNRVFFTDRDLGNQFPDILTAAGLKVERHRDHFVHDCPDEHWLREIGLRRWIGVTHNSRIRYTPNQLQAVVANDVELLVVIGTARYADHARSFISSLDAIARFVASHNPPWIAKVYRPSPSELARRPDAPGAIKLWYPRD